jgi:RIO kinase 1
MAAPRSKRRRFDDDGWQPPTDTIQSLAIFPNDRDDPGDPQGLDVPRELDDEPSWSTYRDAAKGPSPVPSWVVTDPRAIDTDHGVLKSGKEADVSLLDRHLDVIDQPARHCLLAVKRYRSAEHRMFHRDAGYLEGRRVKKSRENRAMATRTAFGRALIAEQWAVAEMAVLSRLWSTGAAVPYPVQLIGTELMMEFIGSPDGIAAPRLAQTRPDRREGRELYQQMIDVLTQLADVGYAHGDLSPYNVLVHEGRLVMIDLPQAIDLVGNPQGFDYLHRDCVNICTWFAHRGVHEADADDLYRTLLRSVPGVS